MSTHISTLTGCIDLAALHQHNCERYPYLLASTASALSSHRNNSRYDILFAFPGDALRLDEAYSLKGVERFHRDSDFLHTFNSWFSDERQHADTDLPFSGGWFFYLSYELAKQVEPVLDMSPPHADEPVAIAIRIPAAVIIDHHDDKTYLIAEDAHAELIDIMRRDIDQMHIPVADNRRISVSSIIEQDTERYFTQVADIKRYIYEGDIFQANLSRLWTIEMNADYSDYQLFTALKESNPASFACLVKLDQHSLISSSPERLVRVHDSVVETRPIAGTRPRADDVDEDDNLSTTLMSHPKERAEHIMLIDLERNDLGRVCEAGSVEVDELLTLESWQHVHHIVSNVRGRLRDDVLPGDVIRATFPGGTITGCPKVRCMQILAEQEQQPRGAYTGSVGYINRDGSMDSNILIRTMTRRGNELRLRAGGGIVTDSDAAMELEETRAKARGLLNIFSNLETSVVEPT